MFKTIS